MKTGHLILATVLVSTAAIAENETGTPARFPLCAPEVDETTSRTIPFSANETLAVKQMLASGPLTPTSGTTPIATDSQPCTWPLALQQLPDKSWLLITSQAVPGRDCHACAATLSAHTFAPGPTPQTHTFSQWSFAQTGAWGSPGQLHIQPFSPQRTGIVIENSDMHQGYGVTYLTLFGYDNGKITEPSPSTIYIGATNCGALGTPDCDDLTANWKVTPSSTLEIHFTGMLNHHKVSKFETYTITSTSIIAPPEALILPQY